MIYKISTPVLLLASAAALSGCDPMAAERDAKNRKRIELEEKQRLEIEVANKAITEMNKKAFARKAPSLDLDGSAEKKAAQEPKKSSEP